LRFAAEKAKRDYGLAVDDFRRSLDSRRCVCRDAKKARKSLIPIPKRVGNKRGLKRGLRKKLNKIIYFRNLAAMFRSGSVQPREFNWLLHERFPFADGELDVLHINLPLAQPTWGEEGERLQREAIFSAHRLNTADRFFSEVKRVLKSKGRLVLTVDTSASEFRSDGFFAYMGVFRLNPGAMFATAAKHGFAGRKYPARRPTELSDAESPARRWGILSDSYAGATSPVFTFKRED
jgi:SAM-dependent methyltransferase